MSTSDNDPGAQPGYGSSAAPSGSGYEQAPSWESQGHPGYGQPAYGQPGYGQPTYAPQQHWGPRPTNTMAILALVMAFVVAPVGLILGILARKQIARTGEEGSGLALAGIIVGGLFTAFFVLMIVIMIIAFAGMASYSTY